MSRSTLVALILSLASVSAHAGQTSCVPEYTALNVVERVVPADASAFVHNLRSANGGGMFTTRVQVEGRVSAGEVPALDMTVRFDPAFQGVSLPYNLYTILVISDGRVLNWLDFTDSCRSPGISFFPGREISIPKIKLIGADPQTLQIMVWGRL
jgi:hypothetical protein